MWQSQGRVEERGVVAGGTLTGGQCGGAAGSTDLALPVALGEVLGNNFSQQVVITLFPVASCLPEPSAAVTVSQKTHLCLADLINATTATRCTVSGSGYRSPADACLSACRGRRVATGPGHSQGTARAQEHLSRAGTWPAALGPVHPSL